jgi:phage replication-related protein YjqB (UPF0714/DUF867 family)
MPPSSYGDVLQRGHRRGRDFVVRTGNLHNGQKCLLAAPHGGAIEPGTAAIMLAVARLGDWAWYEFHGCLRMRNWERLHIPSTNFDEPTLLRLLPRVPFVLTFHAQKEIGVPLIDIGGLHREGRDMLVANLNDALAAVGVAARDATAAANVRSIRGLEPTNITNSGILRKGIQLEFSKEARQVLGVVRQRGRGVRAGRELALLAECVHETLRHLVGR